MDKEPYHDKASHMFLFSRVMKLLHALVIKVFPECMHIFSQFLFFVEDALFLFLYFFY